MSSHKIVEYAPGGRSFFGEWFEELDSVSAARVDRYLRRLEAGNLSAVKSVGSGVYEIKMDFGPGYRVYFGWEGRTIVVLLGGGDKSRQSADIAVAIQRWKQYTQETK
ncbi:MAG: type II toxin-antitoxin system RelE/ParE family toxin [Verrucomicrobia bacterium]|nr:type II toxin-antitoxin system RelE/ParE family toxin [Verrucomicrobiota bacterium]